MIYRKKLWRCSPSRQPDPWSPGPDSECMGIDGADRKNSLLHQGFTASGWGWWMQLSPGSLKLWLGDLLSLSHVIRTARSSYRRQNPLYLHPLSRKEQQVGRRWQLAPLLLVQFHTLDFFFNINKLVTFAPHLAGKVSNNTWSPSENTNDWHAVGSGRPLPHSLQLKVPHISRGQTLAWAGAVQDRGHGFEALSP